MVDGHLNFDTSIDTKGFNKGVSSISGELKSLTGMLKKFSVVAAAAFVAKGFISLSRQAIEFASDLQEVQNVVDTAFGSMSYKCEEFSDTSIEMYGMSKLSAKKTASTYMSMAKSMGLSMDSASDMAIEVAKLTGDVASFFNLDQDLASVKLKSIFTGETETLKDLGVVMTEDNLKAYALSQGMTKSYQAMTQAEKVSLRYGFVMDALADAQGDFARTSDSWANQTRVLSERWKELLGILGNGLVQALTPAVKMLNNLMAMLINVANVFSATIGKLFGKQTKITAETARTAAGAAEAEGDLAAATTEAGEAASNSTASFDKLNVLQQAAGGGGAGIGATTEVTTEEETEDDGKESMLEKLSDRIQRLQPYIDRLKDSWNNLKDAFERFGKSTGVCIVLDYLKRLWLLLADRAIAGGALVLAGTLDILAGALDILAGIIAVVVGLLTGDWNLAIGGANQIIHGLQAALKGLGEVIEGVLIFLLGEEAVEALKTFLVEAWNWFSQTSFYTTGIQNVLNGLLMFLKGVFTGDWMLAWEGVKTIFKGVWNGIVSIVEGAVNLIIKAVNWCIDQLNKIYVDVPDWVEELTGMSGFGFNIPNISPVKIPRLATGAVIPPNAEFLAMLGDQKHGNNIEAPEGLIRQIVKEESGAGDIIINANGTLGQLIRLLKLEIDKEGKRTGKSLIKGGAY